MDWSIAPDASARSRCRRAGLAACACFALNLLASIAAAMYLREWSTLPLMESRSHWVQAHLTEWRLSWGTWMLAGPSLVLFYAAFAATLSDEMKLARRVAVAAAAVGLIADLSAEFLLAFMLPKQYAQLPDLVGGQAYVQAVGAADLVFKTEGRATILTGALANGLYVIAGLMLVAVAYATPGFPRALAWSSAPAWLCGAALTVSVLLRNAVFTERAMAALMATFLLWLGAMTVVLWRRAGAPAAPPAAPLPPSAPSEAKVQSQSAPPPVPGA